MSGGLLCDLPDEVLCEIFSKLSPGDVIRYVINVCQRWNVIVNENRRFWDHLQLVIHCDFFINLSYFTEGSINTSNIVFEKELLIGEKDLDKVYNLRYLKFTEGSKSKSLPALLLVRILDIIRKTCRNIEKVEFVSCFGATSEYFFKFLRDCYCNINEVRFGLNCSSIVPYNEISRFVNLTTLISHDYALRRPDLYLLANGCEKLSSLWILFSRSPKVDDILYFLEKKKHVLKELGLGMSLQDCVLEKLKECHSLEVLFATDARYISDQCIKSFSDLPSLKYCSLHRAVFQPKTLREVQLAVPGISTQLIILDMTDYKFLKEFYTLISEYAVPSEVLKKRKFLTFKNSFNNNFRVPWYAESPVHWMYREKALLHELKEFKRWNQEDSISDKGLGTH